ncbi:MAG TPA: FAD-linked oxidase C-terminal domain-containing protein, partial [Pyrinomonadaceae bacterium]|nr:FAD-linked oxidase C-terminal domain-containing protein [Pyrinomonadaceae bacterium]
EFLKYAASVGGTLSAEHGVGKLKRDYLHLFYTGEELRAMAALKKVVDPNGILGRGNIFSEELL